MQEMIQSEPSKPNAITDDTKFYERLGFVNHPFAHTNADEELFLEEYFVPPPFFDSVIGDKWNAHASVILAPRGGGKSALRRSIEMWATHNEVLAVTYDRFDFTGIDSIVKVGLDYHMENIVKRVLIQLFSELINNPGLVKKLDVTLKKMLVAYSNLYFSSISFSEIHKTIATMTSVNEKAKDFWGKNIGVIDAVLKVVLKAIGLSDFNTPEFRKNTTVLDKSYRVQLMDLVSIAQKVGFKSIYILIDKLDETTLTGNSVEDTYQLIAPVIRDIELLSTVGVGFKIFLWDKTINLFRKDARPDRVNQNRLVWPRESLQKVLAERIYSFSDKRIFDFRSVMKNQEDCEKVDAYISILADRSPRNLIRCCNRILIAQSNIDRNSEKIETVAVELGIQDYCQEILAETLEQEDIKLLFRIKSNIFTFQYLKEEVLPRQSKKYALDKKDHWTKTGLLTCLEEIPEDDNLSTYYIASPVLNRLIYKHMNLDGFFSSHWLVCPSCQADLLYDLKNADQSRVPCFECGSYI